MLGQGIAVNERVQDAGFQFVFHRVDIGHMENLVDSLLKLFELIGTKPTGVVKAASLGVLLIIVPGYPASCAANLHSS